MSLFWKEYTKDLHKQKVFRPFNTYGIYAISAVVFFTMGYSIALI
jgi:hypothetical protein